MKLNRTLLLLVPLLANLASAQITLRQAANQRGLLIGAAANADEFGMQNRLLEQPYATTLSRHFNMLTAENAMKWSVIRPTQQEFQLRARRQAGGFRPQERDAVRGHVLTWHGGLPDWMLAYSSTATPTDMSALLEKHIKDVVRHYRGRVFAWDVVNEAFTDVTPGNPTRLRNSAFFNQPGIGRNGTGYIEQAFRWAHEADPNALLFYNDYSIEDNGPKFQAVLNMVRDFVARGVPIHGVGFQMHLDLTGYPANGAFEAAMRQITDLGLQVHITEMDVRLRTDNNGTPTENDLRLQANTYERIAALCLANPKCTAIQTWGFTDNYSWVPGFFPGYGAALLFDRSYAPKPALNALVDVLTKTPPQLSAAGIVNAASYKAGAVAPGELITLFGMNYGPASLVTAELTPDNGFTTDLRGARVLFDGIPAPMVYAVTGQVSTVVPYELAGRSETTVEYQFNGVKSNAVRLNVAPVAPGLFTLNASGSGQGLVVRLPEYTLNSASNPSRAGDIVVVYVTGGGVVAGNPVSGGLAERAFAQAAQVTATIGGVPATVAYAGSAPGLVNGVTQVNVEIPADVPPGDRALVLRMGGMETQTGVTIAVR